MKPPARPISNFDKPLRLLLNGGSVLIHEVAAAPLMKSAPIHLDVNGCVHILDIPADTSLLHVLRNDLGLNGPKFGCGLGECGACAVLVDG
jgi:hypothetical protein